MFFGFGKKNITIKMTSDCPDCIECLEQFIKWMKEGVKVKITDLNYEEGEGDHWLVEKVDK